MIGPQKYHEIHARMTTTSVSTVSTFSKLYNDTRQSTKRNNQNSKSKRQDYNMEQGNTNEL